MTALRVLVVDDEQLAREELCYQLEQAGEIEIVGQAGNGLEALSAVDRLEPDLVFLDIQMPGLGGFEVARRLSDRGDDMPALVFVTAYDQHAIEAFEVAFACRTGIRQIGFIAGNQSASRLLFRGNWSY
jgi:DNA-binding LytR/AlgR family response regulator